MINMSVFHIKDIVKYLVKFVIVAGIVVVFTRYFLTHKEEEEKVTGWIQNLKLLECLDRKIPRY